LSIFTGDTDAVVNPKNSQHLAIHWAQLTESVQQPIISKYQGYQVSQWHGKNKQTNVELIEIEDMGHGITVAPEKTDGGIEAPFVISAPFSTVQYLIAAWKI
jgi:poly(3-hydroxybutyrate) depolymerase